MLGLQLRLPRRITCQIDVLDRKPRCVLRRHGAIMPRTRRIEKRTKLVGRTYRRLLAEAIDLVDQARAAQPWGVSRNEWIAEAIQKRLTEEFGKLPKAAPSGG